MATIPLKDFGSSGVKISALGLGGHHLGDAKDEQTALQIVREAIEGGITFFDNCWEYNRGKSENWMGKALKGHRHDVFLMTKVCTHGRDGALAMRMLEESLRRAEDGDPLDILVLIDANLFPGCLIKARVVGVLEAKQKEGNKNHRNDRLVAIHIQSATWAHIKKLGELPESILQQIEHFFVSYHGLDGTDFQPIGRAGPKTAAKLLDQGIERFEKSRFLSTSPEGKGK